MVYETNHGGTPFHSASTTPQPANQLQIDLMSDGYAIIRNLLPRDQVNTLRRTVTQHFRKNGEYKYGGKFQLHAMYSVADVAKILTGDAILDRLKEITQPLAPVLTGECDLMINTTSSWHNDVPHHPASEDGSIFSDESFRIYKIAFYLQDQDEDALTTLKVRPKSHFKGRDRSKPGTPLAVRAGDAIVFDVRIEHAGQLPTFIDRAMRKFIERVGPWFHMDAQKAFTSTRTIIRGAAGIPDRVAVFMTFGPAEAWTYSYAEQGRNLHPGVHGALSAEVMTRLALKKVMPPLIGTPSSTHH